MFALFHFGLSWLTQLAWLAPAEYAKVQSCSFAFLHFHLGELAQLAMQNCKNARTCKNTDFALFHFFWYGWHEQGEHKLCHFPFFAGTAGMGKARMWWLAQAAYAKVHLHLCTFGWYGWHGHGQRKGGVVGASRICKNAFLRFRLVWLAWVKTMAWLAQTEYAKVQRCSFCIFALSAVMAGTVKLMTWKW